MTADVGSVEGRLRAASLRPPALAVREAVTGRSLACPCSRETAERALNALGRRVVLSGPVLPSEAVEVQKLRVLPREGDLPPAEEAEGILPGE